MEKYDVIIIGAGIAGAGLAYNLKRIGYKGSVLIIDKKEPGANAAYGYRNTFKEVIDKYNLPYKHKFKGIKCGDFKKIFRKIKNDFYFIDYKKTCGYLLSKSNAIFKKEVAFDLSNKILNTNQNKYSFKYLIDCSGHAFFLKKLFKMHLPFRYWIGEVNILFNQLKNKNYYYHLVNSKGFLEDIYPLDKKILQGIWKYSKKMNHKSIHFPKKLFSSKLIKKPAVIKKNIAIIPCTPAFPLVIKNCAFLGDSFGNASTSAAEGIRPILETSELLTDCIKKNKLKDYEKIWKKKYLEKYIQQLSTKLDYKIRLRLFDILKNNPEILIKIVKNDKISIKEIKNKIPKMLILKILKNYIYLKIKFLYNEIM